MTSRTIIFILTNLNLERVIQVSPQTENWKKFEINARLLYLYGDLQNILRLHKNKCTVNSQLQSHIDKHSDLRTLRE